MGAIYQLTFFLALGLLTIVIAVFVFAVSLLGRAMEVAAESEREKLAERKDKNVEAIAVMKEEIAKVEASGQVPKELKHSLNKLQTQNNKYERELSRIRKGPKLLTAEGGVYYTCAFLMGTLVASSVAWYLSTIKGVNFIIPLSIWIIGLLATGYSISRICQSLRVIQNVAVTSEEAWLRRIIDAFKIAEKELEEERRPEVTLRFINVSFPLTLPPDSEKKLDIELNLQKGDYLENAEVFLIVPPDLSFPSIGSPHKLPSDHSYPGFIHTSLDFERIIPGIVYPGSYKIKSPTMPGKYPLVFNIVGKGMRAKWLTEEIIVK